MKLILASLLLLCIAGSAACDTERHEAQVYHCGPDGRDLRDSPCPEPGRSASSVSFDTPDVANRDAARAAAQADARLAAQMQRDRQAAEAEALQRNAAAGSLTAPPSATSAPRQIVLRRYLPRPYKPRPPRPGASAAYAAP